MPEVDVDVVEVGSRGGGGGDGGGGKFSGPIAPTSGVTASPPGSNGLSSIADSPIGTVQSNIVFTMRPFLTCNRFHLRPIMDYIH